MRAWLVVCAALAVLAPARATAAHPASLDTIRAHILAKLGLTSRPTPLGAPPRDVVRQILAHAVDRDQPPPEDHHEQAMREVIAIAHRGLSLVLCAMKNRKEENK